MKVLAYNNPYTYFVIENFLPCEKCQELKEAALESVHWLSSPEYPDRYGMIGNAEVLRKMAGKEMRDFLTELIGAKLQRHQSSVPQLRSTQGMTKGVPVHTDSNCGFNVGVFLHLTDWVPEMGGDLQIWSQGGEGFKLMNTVQPKENTLVVLTFSQKSFHSVSPVVKDVQRLTLLTEWSYS
jgi:2-oxoglutarate-Fe(II)-dependent oxygenase superfamily protein